MPPMMAHAGRPQGGPASPQVCRSLVDARGRTMGGMTTTLITGANKGLGYEAARRLIAARPRRLDRPPATRSAAAPPPTSSARASSSSTSPTTRASPPRRRRVGALDVLDQQRRHRRRPQAGARDDAPTTSARCSTPTCSASSASRRRSCRCSSAPTNPVIVNVSSGMGSIGVTSDPERLESTIVSLAYPTSKTALNMLTIAVREGAAGHARERRRPRLHRRPTSTTTAGTQTVEEGTDAIVRDGDRRRPTARPARSPTAHGTVPW